MSARVRAVILEGDSVLLIHRIKRGQEYWVFPGGGIEQGETPEAALQRESREELGVEVRVGRQLAVHQLNLESKDQQQEIFYFCSIIGGKLGSGRGPEFQKGTSYEGMYVPEWVALAKIPQCCVMPEVIKKKLLEGVAQR